MSIESFLLIIAVSVRHGHNDCSPWNETCLAKFYRSYGPVGSGCFRYLLFLSSLQLSSARSAHWSHGGEIGNFTKDPETKPQRFFWWSEGRQTPVVRQRKEIDQPPRFGETASIFGAKVLFFNVQLVTAFRLCRHHTLHWINFFPYVMSLTLALGNKWSGLKAWAYVFQSMLFPHVNK